MTLVQTVDEAKVLSAPIGVGRQLVVFARGTVPTSGWTSPRLAPRVYISPPADGLWDFDFYADPPAGIVLDVVLPIFAAATVTAPDWCTGIRIVAHTNSLVAAIDKKAVHPTVQSRPEGTPLFVASAGAVIVSQKIAHYEDSWQPTGNTKIDWSGVHIEMKKLDHDLTLTVEGASEQQIRNCISTALAAGVLAAIIAAFATGGLGAANAGLAAAEQTLLACLGAGYTVRFNDDSHWEYWWT